ncbi:MAG: hypothetical protein V4588_08625, partial [Pseudomonadota bacterium]
MNKSMNATVWLVLLLTACQLVPQAKQTRIDEVPMYAGIDRSNSKAAAISLQCIDRDPWEEDTQTAWVVMQFLNVL